MKLTEDKLRQIIREETKQINERVSPGKRREMHRIILEFSKDLTGMAYELKSFGASDAKIKKVLSGLSDLMNQIPEPAKGFN